MNLITEPYHIESVIASFQQSLIDLSVDRLELDWVFPNGEKECCMTYVIPTSLGNMHFAIPSRWGNRQAHLFKLGYEGGSLSPDAEINIPLTLNRRVSGALVSADDGNTLLCHRGALTVFRGSLPRSITLDYFKDWLQYINYEDKLVQMIVISSIESSTIGHDISEFVFAVKNLKESLKNDDKDRVKVSSIEEDGKEIKQKEMHWHTKQEFEGEKTYTPYSDTHNYQYSHGPLCNGLHRKLDELLNGHCELTVSKNIQTDLALVDRATNKAKVIFEVKKSASMSEQLYSAFGQLSYYKHRYGNMDTKLFLVLPKATMADFTEYQFFDAKDVCVVFGVGGTFVTREDIPLEDVLKDLL